MKPELVVAVLVGLLLSAFLIVGEIAVLRTRVAAVRRHIWELLRLGRFLRLLAVLSGIAAFFLVQPFIASLLVALALDGVVPGFSGDVIKQLHEALAAL